MTIIRDMFEKSIDRNISGVIKVDQIAEEQIFTELDEFIVTRELRGHFNDFYKAYSKSFDGATDKMGVWVAGFFGSGKSHFLKILSYLLENREVKGRRTIEFFNEKIDDHVLLADMKRAANFSTDAILFNIESKTDSNTKQKKSAIVDVFMKVFDDRLGYYGEVPWLASIERTLDEDGLYEAFKEAYQEVSGGRWEEERHKIFFVRDDFINAIVKAKPGMSEDSAGQLFDNAESAYSLTPEKFAKIVQKYINKKDAENKNGKHRVIFMVDEMGQYVGDNTDLMLNLQTVAEDLGTHCGGRAWVVVTSQEAIDSVTKERFREQDFSKIQGRFDTRLNLSSSNTDEVIKKRLLAKKEAFRQSLAVIYKDKEPILKNLIGFVGSDGMRGYLSEDEFIDCYPFIPYQFNLLQLVFTSIRKFSHAGKHLAEGERSMLNAFHAAIRSKGDENDDILVSFQSFYETIKTFLDSGIRRIFEQASSEPDLEPFDVDVLKVLFMIKYLKEMKPKLENITTLMIEKIDEDKIALRSKIDGALARLKKHTLIQQNGDDYDFLTDEEQDVSRGIKSIKLEFNEVLAKTCRIIFDELYPVKGFTYSRYNTFNFSRMVDNTPYGKSGEEIMVCVVTPDGGTVFSEQAFKSRTFGDNLLLVVLPEHNRTYFDEIEEALKTEKYLRLKSGTKNSEGVDRIISSKSKEITGRYKRAADYLSDALFNAGYYASSDKLQLASAISAKDKIDKGLKALIVNAYHKLQFITDNVKDDSDIWRILRGIQQSTINGGNIKAEDDMKSYLENRFDWNMSVTMRDLKDRYSKKPYGWALPDIAGVVAKLFSDGVIKLIYNGEQLDTQNKELINYLTKEKEFDRLQVKFRKQIDAHLIEDAKNIALNVFGYFDLPDEGDSLVKRLKSELTTEHDSLRDLNDNYTADKRYPGKDVVGVGISLIKDLISKREDSAFLETIKSHKNALETWKPEIKQVRDFFRATQHGLFDRGVSCVEKYHKNKYSLDGDAELAQIVGSIESILSDPKPYGRIKDIPPLEDDFKKKFDLVLNKEKSRVTDAIDQDIEMLKEELQKYSLSEIFSNPLIDSFNKLKADVDKTDDFNLAPIQKKSRDLLMEHTKKVSAEVKRLNDLKKKPDDPPKPQPKSPAEVNLLNVAGSKKKLETVQDVDEYIDRLRKKLISEINQNRYILLR